MRALRESSDLELILRVLGKLLLKLLVLQFFFIVLIFLIEDGRVVAVDLDRACGVLHEGGSMTHELHQVIIWG